MKVEIVIDETCLEPRVVVFTREITAEINDLVKKIAETPNNGFLVGYQGDRLEILPPESVVRIFAEQQKVLAQTESGVYSLRLRLYEVEEKLNHADFVRISNSEIVNFRKVKNMDMGFNGTLCIVFRSGERAYVSRRYVAKIKNYLGI